MTQPRVVIDYLRDMVESTSNALDFVAGMSFDDFQKDAKTQFAVVRALEIITYNKFWQTNWLSNR